jgi:hypothetical protein
MRLRFKLLVVLFLSGLAFTSLQTVSLSWKLEAKKNLPSSSTTPPLTASDFLKDSDVPLPVAKGQCPSECLFERPDEKKKLGLIGFLSVRIFPEDKALFRTQELVQWLQYMRFSGVEKMIIWDSHTKAAESQQAALQPLIEAGFVQWIDWSKYNPYDYQNTQMRAYHEGWKEWQSKAYWVIHCDVDEYPVVPKDARRGFLVRKLRELEQQQGRVGTVLLENFGFLGNRNTAKELVIDQFRERTKTTLNHLTKPIENTAGTASIEMHFPAVKQGYVQLKGTEYGLYMAHYWGSRLWGFDETKEMPDDLKAKVAPNNGKQKNKENKTTLYLSSLDLEGASAHLQGCVAQCSREDFFWIR